MTDAERDDLAAMLKSVTSTYDKVFDTPFPYSMGLHPQPYDWVGASGVALSSALLSAAAAVGYGAEVHGGV